MYHMSKIWQCMLYFLHHTVITKRYTKSSNVIFCKKFQDQKTYPVLDYITIYCITFFYTTSHHTCIKLHDVGLHYIIQYWILSIVYYAVFLMSYIIPILFTYFMIHVCSTVHILYYFWRQYTSILLCIYMYIYVCVCVFSKLSIIYHIWNKWIAQCVSSIFTYILPS